MSEADRAKRLEAVLALCDWQVERTEPRGYAVDPETGAFKTGERRGHRKRGRPRTT